MPKPQKRVNRQDSTLRNVRAANRKIKALDVRVSELERGWVEAVAGLAYRIAALEAK